MYKSVNMNQSLRVSTNKGLAVTRLKYLQQTREKDTLFFLLPTGVEGIKNHLFIKKQCFEDQCQRSIHL